MAKTITGVDYEGGKVVGVTISGIIDADNDQPTSAYFQRVRHGRWLPQVVLGQKAWDCSECKTLGSPQWKWCPVCGAKMDEERT